MRATVLLFAATSALAAGPQPGDQGTPEYERAAALVRQLGAPRFAVREAAAKELVAMGGAAIPALTAGTRSGDEEVRTRSVSLLPHARAAEWKRRSEAYLNDKDGNQKHDLPLLPEFETLIRKPDAGSRTLFAEMMRTNGALLDQAARDRKAAAAALRARCQTLNTQLRTTGEYLKAEVGDLAALFFVHSLVTTPNADWRSPDSAAFLLANPGLADGLNAKDVGPAFRRILARWSESRPADDAVAHQCFTLAVRETPFPEAVPLLARLANDGTAMTHNVRGPSIEALGKVADDAAKAALADLVADTAPVFGNEQYRLGDHALATLLKTQKKRPSDYGLSSIIILRLKAGFGRGEFAQVEFFGFPSAEDREKGIKKWKDEAPKK